VSTTVELEADVTAENRLTVGVEDDTAIIAAVTA